MAEAKYLVGIDLGTSNCAVAYAEPAQGPGAQILDFPIPQLRRPGEVGSGKLLPSCIYLPSEQELTPEATRLPWVDQPDSIVGEFARWQGSRVPGRLVASAKSWLCHEGVDRSAPILPWGAPAENPKISPLTASARLLKHMARAWDSEHPNEPLANQEVIITVPASFDEVARALTVQAASLAGLGKFTLLEEPQAAFYDFTSHHRSALDKVLQDIRLVLVVDVGGGTSDFTLVQAGSSPEGAVLRRIAVGEHLMLGGDNMDAALARKAEESIVARGRKLTATQWTQLTQAARLAKEALLVDAAPDHYNISIAGEGSKMIGGSLSAKLERAEVERIILDGFFPACGPDAATKRATRIAFQELGLPFAHEPAVTHHLAEFLRAHAKATIKMLGGQESESLMPRPDVILLNGGVFISPKITQRLIQIVSSWWPSSPPIPLLSHDSLELAVARGAAYYGLARRGLGKRIGGGAAHALYVGLETAKGESASALCVIPRGHEEGATVELGNRVFKLALGRPVRFPLYSTAGDRLERAGDIVPLTEELHPLPPIHALLKSTAKGGNIPIHLRATLTEIGTLELWCVSNSSDERWRLEFELRGAATESTVRVAESIPPAFAGAREWVERIFGTKPLASKPASNLIGTPPKDVKQLWNSLEQTLGPREQWRVSVLRELWSVLFAGASRRRRSADHERIFFQLFGYTLRPGFGYPLDEWRCEQSARLFGESIQHHKEKVIWNEFWILWRRIAGGLSETRHEEIWNYLRPHLAQRISARGPKQVQRLKGLHPEGLDEMVRLAAALEHLPAMAKSELGGWITGRLQQGGNPSGPWTWALGRLGARTPIYGSIHKTLAPEVAATWVNLLLDPELLKVEGSLFALAQLARLTGDRARDLEESTRGRVLEALRVANSPPSWQRMVSEVVAMAQADSARALGDALPVGLSLA